MPLGLLNDSGNSTGKLEITSLLLLFPATCGWRVEAFISLFPTRDEHELFIRRNPAGYSAKEKARRRITAAGLQAPATLGNHGSLPSCHLTYFSCLSNWTKVQPGLYFRGYFSCSYSSFNIRLAL